MPPSRYSRMIRVSRNWNPIFFHTWHIHSKIVQKNPNSAVSVLKNEIIQELFYQIDL
jgi:hypothetical protein